MKLRKPIHSSTPRTSVEARKAARRLQALDRERTAILGTFPDLAALVARDRGALSTRHREARRLG